MSILSYDAEGMVEAAEQARKLRDNVDNTRKTLVKLYLELQECTGLDCPADLDLSSIVSQKALREQSERLERLTSVLCDAAGLADEVTNETTSWLDELRLKIFAKGADGKIHISPAAGLASAATAIGGAFGSLHSSVIHAPQKVSDSLESGKQKLTQVVIAQALAKFLSEHPNASKSIQLLRNNDYTDKQIYNLIQKGGEKAVEKEATRYGYASPLGAKVTKVNKNALYPRYSGGSKHNGIDIYAKKGTPLYAIKGGTVLFSKRETLSNGDPAMGGNCILILGEDGYYYYYAHLNGFNVKKPAKVVSGDLIGWTGNSSNRSMAEHLHLTIAIPLKSPIPVPADSLGKYWLGNKQGYVIDPYAYLQDKIQLTAK
jgi:murein DD-endopeptidase MepM/ murein hydrolase activator NlpD